MPRKRMRVRGLDAWLTLGVALLSGIGVAMAGPSPTGTEAIDVLLVVITTTICIWAAASAPWWAGVIVAAAAAALAPSPALLTLAAVAMIGGLVVGMAQRAVPWSRAVVAGAAAQVLARLGNVERFGLSSLISVLLLVVLAYLGIRRRPRRDRRILWITLASAAGVVIIAGLGIGGAALAARHDLQTGNREARAGIDQLSDGDFDAARESFLRAAEVFDQADSALSKPWTQPARLVPVLAQHRNSAVGLVHRAADVSSTIAALLDVIDYDSLRVVNGRIDTNSIALLEAPLTDLTKAIDDLETTVQKANSSPWLVNALHSRLDDLSSDIDRQQERGDHALAAVKQAPAMLGANGPRVYFVAFTTPAEARGLGGFMGNWAEVTITQGRIRLTDFGRTADLIARGAVSKTLTGPPDLLRNYGDFLLSDVEAGVVGSGAWPNITVSPDFPAVAQTIVELYPQSGGQQLDGVFVMDVETISKLMEISGPVQLDEIGVEVGADNAVKYLLHDQYLIGESEEVRVDALETVARTTVTRLLTSELPAPPELAELLSPMASQGRLSGWAVRPDEEAVFERIGMSGALPVRDSDGIVISFNNAGGNKIDDLLEGTASYEVHPDLASGTATATLTIDLTNTAPASGLPNSIIGNLRDLPIGTNSMYLSVYTALPFISATLDGQPYPFSLGADGSYLVASSFVDIAPGTTAHVVLELDGGLDLSRGYSVVVRTPPTAQPFPISVTMDRAVISEGNLGVPGVRTYRG